MSKRILFACLLSTFAVTGPRALAADEISSADKKFVETAGSGGMTEVELGQYAAANGDSQDVKDFGQHMATDHKKANEELQQLALSKKIEAPPSPNSKDQKKIDKLEKLKGAEFDKEYAAAMVKDHEDTIATFEKETKKGEDADLKAFAEKTLPTLNHHLEMAKAMNTKVTDAK